jgi:uncharacterized protein
MSGTWPKIILDPVHNIINFEDRAPHKLLLDLINTREFQRLRRIKQLGMSELVFPGSNHSRFAHSIGVMHVARMFIERLQLVSRRPLTEYQEGMVLAAALLHDVGHGPFSHAFEKITGEDHEKRTGEVILSPGTDVNRVLTKFSADLPTHIDMFFKVDAPGSPTPADIPLYYKDVISSQLDADRFDYLLRDTYATGTTYGDFDLKWLIQHLELQFSPTPRIYVGRKAFITTEAYIFARYHMYRTVYFHKTTRAAEVMLKLLFRRFKTLVDAATSSAAKSKIVPSAPPGVLEAFTSSMSLSQYLLLDDYTVTEFMKSCQSATDPILRDLGSGLVHRRLYKAVDATGVAQETVLEFDRLARQLVKERGHDPDFALAVDSPGDTPYKAMSYEPSSVKPIMIDTPTGIKEISMASAAVKALEDKFSLLRYYFPLELSADINKIADSTLRR